MIQLCSFRSVPLKASHPDLWIKVWSFFWSTAASISLIGHFFTPLIPWASVAAISCTWMTDSGSVLWCWVMNTGTPFLWQALITCTHNLLHDVHLLTHDIVTVFIIDLYVHYDHGHVAHFVPLILWWLFPSHRCHVCDPHPYIFMPVCCFRMPLSGTETSSASYPVWEPLIVIVMDSYHFNNNSY